MELGLILFLVSLHLSAISSLPARSTASTGGANDEAARRSKVRREQVEWNGRKRTAHLLDTLDEYDLVRPTIVDHSGQFLAHIPHPSLGSNPRRQRRQAPPGDKNWIYFRLTAFGRDFRLNLTQSRDFVSPSLTVEYWNGSGVVNRTQMKEQPGGGRMCHFVGHVISDGRTSKAAVSNCHGLHGVFATHDDEYLVEPFWAEENETTLDRQDFHIVYRRSAILRTSSHCGLTDTHISDSPVSSTDRSPKRPKQPKRPHHFWSKEEDTWSQPEEVGMRGSNGREGGMRRRRRRSVVSKRSYVETLVVADKEMVGYHGQDRLESYLLTVMNIVARLFHDESIGNDINIIVTRIIILTAQEPGLQISYHADRSLESFCLWQQKISSMATATVSNRVDQEIPSHDNAVLLTRYDICTYKNLPCGTLGLAPVAGMCEPHRSCSINEDIGLATAFTVAHEIGHNFGMQHDGAGNDCGTSGHESARLMSSQLAKNREPFSWSSCSRNYITNFLDSGRGKCLENYPSQTKFPFPDRLAGAIHDGNSQCRLLFGPASVQCKRNEEVCRELWCINPNNYQCVTNSIPAAEGTHCLLTNNTSTPTDGWCYRGKCVRTDWRPQPLDGQWGEWSSWGQCSRTCGGGVESSDRRCDRPRPTDGGKFCIGDRQRYRSCRTQECAPDSTDFRELQCAKFNNQLFRNKLYTWKPFAGDHVRPCALNCLAVGFNFYTERSAKVIDGTKCHPDSLDICVNGECRHVGCDRILGSSAVEDKCRVCGGDGSTCQTVRGRVDQAMEREASDTYFEIARIPQGAVHIRFVETRISKNYLALKSPDGRFFINGDWTIDWPRSFEVDETVFRYERPKDRPETLTAVGPTNSELVLITLIQETSLNVEYEYNMASAAAASAATTSSVSYTWQYLQWSDCSVTCGKGISRSIAVCVVASSKMVVKHKFCLSSDRPQPEDRIKYCSDQPCPPEWISGEWTECSRTCGSGLRTRQVVCSRRVSAAGEAEVVDAVSCSGKRPKTKWRCNEEACPSAHWQTDDWSECRAPCGLGIRTRNIYCVGDDGSFVPIDQCDPVTRPSGQDECQLSACPLPRWTTGAWGECSWPCDGAGASFQMRTIACRTYNGEPSNSCDPRTMPSNRQECHGRCAAATPPEPPRRPEDCTDINKVEYCPLVFKFRLCSRPYFQQLCCQTCSASRL